MRPEVPPEVNAVVRKLLAKRPEDRYQTPAELAAVLAALLNTTHAPARAEGSGPAARRGARPALPPEDAAAIITWAGLASDETTDDEVAPRPVRGRPARSRRTWLPLAAGLGVLVGLVAVLAYVVVYYGGSDGSAPPPARPPGAVVVDAAGDWQDTGVDVYEDERFQISATGQWGKGEKRCEAAGLPDEPRDRAVLPTAPLLALLVRVGDDAYPLAVTREAMHAPRAGRLFLRANDLDPAGNSGSVQATISGGSRSGRPLPSPGPCLAEAAEAAAADLRAGADDPAADPEALRRDLAAFRRLYAARPRWGRPARCSPACCPGCRRPSTGCGARTSPPSDCARRARPATPRRWDGWWRSSAMTSACATGRGVGNTLQSRRKGPGLGERPGRGPVGRGLGPGASPAADQLRRRDSSLRVLPRRQPPRRRWRRCRR